MAKNILVINVDLRETRVALIEDGIIAELHVERAATRGTLGNIVLGKVTRVLPGMQAAFIDVGLERAAFLHVEDLIRPDDFEAYLGGAKRDEEDPQEPDGGDSGEARRRSPAAAAGAALSVPSDAEVGPEEGGDAEGEEGGGPEAEGDSEGLVAEVEGEPAQDLDAAADDEEGSDSEVEADSEGEADAEAGEDEDAEAGDVGSDRAQEGAPVDSFGGTDGGTAVEPTDGSLVAIEPTELEEVTVRVTTGGRGAASSPDRAERAPSEPATVAAASHAPPTAPAVEPGSEPGAPAPAPLAQSGSTPGQAGYRTARKPSGPRQGQKEEKDGRGGGQGEGRGFRGKRLVRYGREKARAHKGRGLNKARNGHRDTSRISRSTPIREVVREGQEVIVQVSKEPIGTKGARVTSHISLPGRYVVYMPTVDHVGISKRIGSDKERARLREAIESIKPPTGGLIVRTVAEGLTKKQLKADVGYLVRLWAEVAKKRDGGSRAPTLLYQELDLVLKTARDLFTDDIEQIVIDDKEQYQRLARFVEMFMPERAKDIVLYSGDEPIFDAYGIEDEIGRALSRKVPLPSGGYLIIDQAEALTAIDVNTGRYVGKGSKDLEDTLYKTNLEAVEEIAYQLRFRNLGGLIVLDLIDMERASNREKIRRRLEELLQKDKAKTTLNRISDLGLIEMTRKRTRESLGRSLHEPCFYCDGTGQLQSKQTIAYEILRQMRRDRAFLPGYSVVVNAHPAVIDLMKAEEREAVQEAERRFMRRIELVPRREYHLEQFDLAGK